MKTAKKESRVCVCRYVLSVTQHNFSIIPNFANKTRRCKASLIYVLALKNHALSTIRLKCYTHLLNYYCLPSMVETTPKFKNILIKDTGIHAYTGRNSIFTFVMRISFAMS